MNLNLITKLCEDCIKEGEILIQNKWVNDNMGGMPILNPTVYVPLEGFTEWASNCNVLINMLGELAKPWAKILGGNKSNKLTNAKNMQGALKSLKGAIEKGYLIKIEDLIFAEAFSNLIEQAEYLLKQKYHLAAGVLARAVLEERLRNICSSEGIIFPSSRPTLSKFNTELYKKRYYDKIEFKNIDFLTAIGNNAAHNKPVTNNEIQKLIDGVLDFLKRYR